MKTMVVQRRAEQVRTTYTIRDADGTFVDSLTFRDVMALAAADAGRVHARWRNSHSPWFSDRYLHPECDDHGVGHGTIEGLQRRWNRRPLLDPDVRSEGLIVLTPWGRWVLGEVRRLAAHKLGQAPDLLAEGGVG